MRRIAAATVLALSFAYPAQALEEPLPEVPSWTVQDWLNQWAATQIDTLDVESLGDWRWMRDTYFPPPPQTVPTRRVAAQDQPEPAPITQPAYSPGVEQWRPLVVVYWPVGLVEWALRIMACESGGDPYANNPLSSAAGLFQFLRSTWDRGPAPALGLGSYDSGAVFNPEWNIMAAAWLYANWGGKSQWECKA